MKLTDVQVAKALGWKKAKPKRQWGGEPKWVWANGNDELSVLPRYTRSLDALVGEIEARGLFWMIAANGAGKFLAEVGKQDSIGLTAKFNKRSGPTAPLALCAALLVYLKEQRP